MTMLETPRQTATQDAIANRLAAAWRCEWGRMGPYSPFDVYLMREKKIVALVEIRTRQNRQFATFPTVMLDLDKWFHLMQGEVVMQLAGVYVVAFPDGIWWLRIGTLPVNTFKVTFRGRTDRPEAPNDQSPVIEVPCASFHRLGSSDGVFTP
jgi:hypothetical protein